MKKSYSIMGFDWGYKGMTMNKKQLTLKLSVISMAILLASCGGGGSKGYYNNQGGDSSTNPTNPGTGEEVKAVNIGALELLDQNNIPTVAITSEGVIAKVKVTDQSNNGISGALVTFSATGGVILGSSNGAVLTNADGYAIISVRPENINITGAYQISASADYNGLSVATSPKNFSLQATNIILSDLQVAENNLEVGGTTNVTLKSLNATTLSPQNNVSVTFDATCGTFEPATVVSSNQGNIVTSYKAIAANGELCESSQTIGVSGQNIPRLEIPVQIAQIKPDSLVYTTTSPVNLGIKSSGSAASGQIEFTLYANGSPAKDKEVELKIIDAPIDLEFVSLGNRASKIVKSDSSGKVRVNLYPGNTPGPVEIQATLVSDKNVFVRSKDVSVSSGRVTQNALSLSVTKQALRTDIDGDVSTIVARMADRLGNPVPDGTVISFVSEGGRIEPSCASVKGECSVRLITQNPRPINNRVTVLAYVEGDKDYIDVNGDQLYTEGVDQLTHNIGSIFRDDNEDNIHNVGEFIYTKASGALACAASSISQPNVPNTCNNGLSAILRQQLLFAFSHDTPTFVWGSGIEQDTGRILSGNGSFKFQVFGNTQKTVPMPSGTGVSVTVKDNTENNNSCEAEIISGSLPVPSTMQLFTPNTFGNVGNEVVSYTVRLLKCAAGDDVKLTTNVPGGKSQTVYLEIK
ncbi:hypothetical protein [Acinetobacter haemolyticus]|uniref:Big-1 domain-containing protein n=4 Tax=Acinetobacter TaxID=469 RepID=N9FH57_ACIHA|nr:hypothetical protein [Acinetobacter haemolyticus]ENW17938.1 hypothetical protein F926_03072 [Acinetobacter haemolyticus NIPH 261]ENW22083.1 hypothetical protein F927_00186 [Acinetobacter haemolyticus CIP 64.3 = MTCC 9819]MQZ31774.1 hypothetical protein [Acinetobacter haemolyticus]NAR51087.1 hypothetical protein [Acinetobacter haemolyticus]NAR53566.1 hypothetical protein [Acinetobacter haemolyticus]